MIGAAQLPQIKPGAMLVKAITKVRTAVPARVGRRR